MQIPVLALSLFFHISATVIWIGGLLITCVLVWPEIRRILAESPALYQLLSRLRQRFFPISNLALGVLIVTGLFQMSLDPNYDGLLSFNNDWSRIMLVKHLLIVVMALAGLLLQWGVVPSLERASLLQERGKGDPAAWQTLRQREVRLTWLNAGLGVLVLACSAWASSI